ncbi:hypothetical protein JCM19046_1711 [Bacillus sp. JCM 19046]|nr:hypothetical protein JCM19045_290 [Bacillus sp. JCM 19045]GAF17211.1 hypothetical protein JCM19046_1711 [Bacillus sp. JCM 19046]
MNTKTLNVVKNVLIVIALMLLVSSLVLLILRESGTNQFGSTPILLTIASFPLIIAVAGIRTTLKKRDEVV